MLRLFRLWFFLVCGSISALPAVEDSSSAGIVQEVEDNGSQRLHQLFQRYLEWTLNEFPEKGSHWGYYSCNDRWTDLSAEAIASRMDSFSNLCQDLFNLSIDPYKLSVNDCINYALFHRELFVHPYDYYFSLYNGVHRDISDTLNRMPKETMADYRNLLARLRGIPTLIDQKIALLAADLAQGYTPPKILLRSVSDSLLKMVPEQVRESSLFKPFKHLPKSISAKEKKSLVKEAETVLQEKVYPAFYHLHNYLTEQYIPQCRETTALSDLPQGQECYLNCIEFYTSSKRTPEEIHHIGLSEVERIHIELNKLFEKIQFKGSLKEFIHFLNTDPQFFYLKRRDLLRGYRHLLKKIEHQLPKLFYDYPQLPYHMVFAPKHQMSALAYYVPGALFPKRPGQFFISHPKTNPKWLMENVALHEGIPGHHFQMSLALELGHLPEFRKHASLMAYIEGWAHYCEGLGADLCLRSDSYSHFYRWMSQLASAAGLVVDTGLHALGWSRQEGIDYLVQHTYRELADAEDQVDRYLSWPGQILAYKIGELKFLELKKMAQEQLGELFDIRAFHQALLSQGALPLDILETYMRLWIKAVIASEEDRKRQAG
jgi:uncharacterized protein (DUF885 family)